MTEILTSRWDLEDENEEFTARIAFLEASIVLLLLNENLAERLQEILLEEINQCDKRCKGKTIYDLLRNSESWESLVAPNIIYPEVLDTFLKGLYTKVESYRKHGNLNS